MKEEYLLRFLKPGGDFRLLMVLEERFVGTINPFNNILHGLTAQLIPLRETASFQLGNMLLQPVGRQMLAIQLVIAPVDGNAVVPDGGSRVDGFIQVAVPLAVVQLIPIGFNHLHGCFILSDYLYLLYLCTNQVQLRLISPQLKQGVLRRILIKNFYKEALEDHGVHEVLCRYS